MISSARSRLQQLRRAVLVAAVASGAADPAAAGAIEDIRFSRTGLLTVADIAFGCQMRYLDHSPRTGGSELRIRLGLGRGCKSTLGGIRNELYRPGARHLADVVELEFDNAGPDQATIVVRFEHAVGFDVSQGAMTNRLQIEIDPAVPGAAQAAAPPTTMPVPAAQPTAPAAPAPSDDARRAPLRLLPPRESPIESQYAIRLASYAPQQDIDARVSTGLDGLTVYTTDVVIDGRVWKELRLGFFASEDAAQAQLSRLSGEFPDAWVAVAGLEEQRAAAEARPAASQPTPPAGPAVRAAAASSPDPGRAALSAQRLAELMSEAKAALLNRDFDTSIRIYTRLLEEPDGEHRRQAREFLGVAREKNGQLAHARAEYRAYLTEFPDGADARRVQQRLAALPGLTEDRTDSLRSARTAEAAGWDLYGAVSQFYLRGAHRLGDDAEEIVSQSALLSQTDLLVRRRGERVDLLGRANLAYMYDLMEGDTGRGDQALVSFAYLDLADRALGLGTRIGRQTRYAGGVLGRFDGAHISYAWRPDLSINLTTGLPVDSPRHVPNTRRWFYGASVDLSNVAGVWDFSAFVNLQQVDGISDREAFGAEVQYHDSRFNLVGLLDYDASYNVLNTALFLGNWRLNERFTLNGRYHFGAGPFLTTSNALIGQPVTTIEALLDTYREPQIRRLARNRTDQVQYASAGFSAAMSQRWQLNADVGFGDNEGTVSSGGVAALPAFGPQYYLSADFIGSSVLKVHDTVIFGLRHNSSGTHVTNTAVLDLRYPIGDGLRVNPRLAVSLRDIESDGSQQWVAAPMLRLLYRWGRRYRLELEAGGEWSSRELPPELMTPLSSETEESSAYYLMLGYWMDF